MQQADRLFRTPERETLAQDAHAPAFFDSCPVSRGGVRGVIPYKAGCQGVFAFTLREAAPAVSSFTRDGEAQINIMAAGHLRGRIAAAVRKGRL